MRSGGEPPATTLGADGAHAVVTVLVVDDEPDVRLIARMVLTAADFEVWEVPSGEAALAELADGRSPDVVLLDLRMPGLDGWQVLRHLRSDPGLVDLPVVVFTADLDGRAEASAELRPGDVLITKPFQADDLLQAVQQAVGH
jgi:CheY-like chemotaxis protein